MQHIKEHVRYTEVNDKGKYGKSYFELTMAKGTYMEWQKHFYGKHFFPSIGSQK